MDEFVSKTELAQSFQRYEPFQKLLMKFGVRDKGCEILKVKRNLLSLTKVKRTRGSDNVRNNCVIYGLYVDYLIGFRSCDLLLS